MALTGTTHLITTLYQVKGWNLYKKTVDKSGKIVSRVYKKQVVEGNRVKTMIKTIGKNTQKMTTTFTKATGKTNDLMKALKRAAIVAPVWLALRAVMMGVIRTLTEGAKYWEEFDKAIQKSKQVIHGAMGTINEAVVELTSNITDLSIETGQSMAKLSSSFYRFGTVGLDFQKSMEGMETSTRLATVMFGNSDEIARVLAQAYRLLGDSIDENIPQQQKLAVTGAQIYKLWKDNAFEINEFSGALQQFLPVANVYNFSMKETIALLATLQTAGLKATKAGRLLRTGTSKLVSNLDQVALTLGVHVNPELDSTFDVLMRVLKVIKKLSDAGGELPIEALEAMTIFGGVRSRQAGLALVALYDTLIQNLKNVNTEQGKYNDLLREQDEAYQDILKSHHKQIERFRNLRTLIGQSLVQSAAGGKNFADAMDTVNVIMEALIHPINEVRQAFEKLWKGEEKWMEEELARWRALKTLEEDISFKFLPSIGRYVTPEIQKPDEKIEEPRKKLSRAIEYQLGLLKQELTYIQLQNEGFNKSQVAQKKLENYLKSKVKLYNTTDRVIAGEVEKLNEQEVISLALVGNYEEILNLSKGTAIAEADILKIEKMRQAITIEADKIGKKRLQLLIQHESNLLKIKGATNSQIIEATIAMNSQLGIGQDALSLLKNQLALEKEITKEKLGQTKLSSETMKLYEIAQKYGLREAMAIGKIVKGGFDISLIGQLGTKYKNILDEFFGKQVTGRKAERWTRELEGKRIFSREREAMKGLRTPADIARRAEELIPEISMRKLQLPAITTKIDKIVINIKQALSEALEEKGASQSILDQLAEAIKTNPKIKGAIEEVIENY